MEPKRIHFDDDPVGPVVEGLVPGKGVAVVPTHVGEVDGGPDVRRDPKPERLQPLEGRPLVVWGVSALRPSEAVDEDVQRPQSSGGGIELSDRASGGIPWIGEGRLTALLALRIEVAKPVPREDDLAPDLEPVGKVRLWTRSGMLFTVLRFGVTSSPSVPVPRVAPRNNTPCS